MPNHNFQDPRDYGNGRHWDDALDPDHGTYGDSHDRENPFIELQQQKSGRRNRRASKNRDRERGENRANRW